MEKAVTFSTVDPLFHLKRKNPHYADRMYRAALQKAVSQRTSGLFTGWERMPSQESLSPIGFLGPSLRLPILRLPASIWKRSSCAPWECSCWRLVFSERLGDVIRWARNARVPTLSQAYNVACKYRGTCASLGHAAGSVCWNEDSQRSRELNFSLKEVIR